MRTGDKLVSVVMAIGLALVGISHHSTTKRCLSSAKPKTASTAPRFVSPFTGEYERNNAVLYCRDSDGTLHRHREKRYDW